MSDADLIESVQQFSVIWDKKDPNHKNKLVVRNAWNAIGSALQLTANECEQRFANIRNRYSKERRLMQDATRSGSGAHKVLWPHFTACSFLDKIVVSRRRSNYNNAKSSKNESNLDEPEFTTMEDILNNQSDDETLTLHDVFLTRQNHETMSSTSTTPCSSYANRRSMPPTHSASQTPSSQAITSGRQSSMSSHSSIESSGFNEKTSRKPRKIVKTDEITNLSKSIVGAFDKIDELLANSSQSEEIPLELTDEDYAFGRTVALSLKQISSNKLKLKLKAQIMSCIAEAADD